MASSDAWELLDRFRREWIGRKTEPREEDYAELIEDAIWRGYQYRPHDGRGEGRR